MSLGDIMSTKNIRLGSTELKLILTLEGEEKSIFTTADAYKILKSTRDSVNTALYRLRKKGRVEKIERGKYLLIPAKAGYKGKWAEVPFVIANHLVKPYYIGFASALNYWGMTEQVPSVTFVVTTKRKENIKFGPLTFKFVTITKKRFFGTTEGKIGNDSFNVSDKEKTIIDCLLHPEYCGGLDEVAKAIWEEGDGLDFLKLFNYARDIKVDVVTRRLLYLLEILKMSKKVKNMIEMPKPKGFLLLDPSWPKENIEYSHEYGLILNRTKDSLTRWMRH
ncbi:MAG: transcriptional regulator [Candidatus Nitrosotenuis sp.]|nr:MAG: transcriptional regulator [Candidatus Nitrosotenuis sp.]